MTRAWVILRHGEREDVVNPKHWRTSNPDLHASDPPLAAKGRKQAEAAAMRIRQDNEAPSRQVGAIVTSPYMRCVATADKVAEVMDLPLWIEPGICEVLHGHNFPPKFLDTAQLKAKFTRVDEDYVPIVPKSALKSEWGDDECATRSAATAARIVKERCDGLDAVMMVGHGASCYGMVEGLSSSRSGFYQGLGTLSTISPGGDVELQGCSKHLQGKLGTNLRAY